MCGIFAYFSKNNITQIFLEHLTAQGMKCRLRGPDNTVSRVIGEDVFLLFHRLKINDMSESGNQPLVHPDDYNLTLICNGEIYNWKTLADENNFHTKSSSDCEIILHMYKKYGIEKTVKSLDGVFAFVLIDKTNNKIYAARDPIGVRSMFISYDNNGIGIASEMKCLDGVSEQCDIDQFRPGFYWEINEGYTQYYNYQYPLIDRVTDAEIMLNINRLLSDAVHKRLLSDRPIGCLLSGGFDSSLITALVAKHFNRGELCTFSVGLEGSVDLKYAKQVADYLGTKHHQIILTEESMFNAIPEVIRKLETYDTTTIRASTPMYLLSKYIKENTDITVIFSGEGADELSGSYMYFHNAPNEKEFTDETLRLITDLHYYDVLRCDKATACNGLEVRVPFLDKAFVEYYVGLRGKYKMPRNYSIEKYLLRKAFSADKLLPDEVLWRVKEAMSDGVSSQKRGWFEIIQENVDKLISDEEFHNAAYSINPPLIKEAYYFRKIFSEEYKNRDNIIPYYWLPKWSGDQVDPSARILNVYNKEKSS
tara:strand:- start:48 stop:1655 length:1608 start_codon:yes stop_codon:yes gene_type:complete